MFSLADEVLLAARLEDGVYTTSVLAAQPQPVRRRALVRILQENGLFSFQDAHVTALDEALLSGHGGVDIPGGFRGIVSQGKIVIVPHMTNETSSEQQLFCKPGQVTTVSWGGRTYTLSVYDREEYELYKKVHKMFFKYTIAYDTIHGNLCLRSRREGDYMHPAGRKIGKSLKKLLIEWRVPSFARDGLPLLCDDAGVLLVPGYACDERVRPNEKTKHFLVWQALSETG